jgi:hypothetical protein
MIVHPLKPAVVGMTRNECAFGRVNGRGGCAYHPLCKQGQGKKQHTTQEEQPVPSHVKNGLFRF